MLKETSSVDDKPDALNNKVIKALQEIFTILKEIQKIQEINFITVSNIKNALNIKQQSIALKSASSSHNVTLTQTVISAKPSTPAVKNPNANKKNAEKNDADNKNADNKNINKNDANKNANNKNTNKKNAENENVKKADANVTSDVSSKDFQNWFFGWGDL
ncbi:uncharacterized protein CIMG_13237 [Coccidioides immitis RS]|uniref:Uncharacterized protein n=1 Tax=Coccidioides immitis (strain RS) TaxID=246410 RepID=A0A0D8JWZ3_COCIM|nr:uncharacterized protein CIMG_13237 [Coccidioides immitis RS]KJF60798.1 hypothetical protein CIMG_13237 [Coccidioides immitis RS]